MYDPLRAKTKVVFYSVTAFVVGLGMASGFGWTATSLALPTIDESPQVNEASVRPARDLSDAFVNISNVVTPAIVRIEARHPITASRQQVPENLQRFFGPDGAPDGPRGGQVGGGSGFIVSQDGYILTNDHVVSGSDQILVYFPDRRMAVATLVGTDPFTDVAVIKVDMDEPLPTLSFGDSNETEVGQWVLAIGNPGFGTGNQLDYTVTAGIISARGRGLGLIQQELSRDSRTAERASYSIEDYIQTDAVINPGNSGGPMVDISGRVIGINSAIASATGYYQGYGFAIPINLARRVMEDLIEYGHTRRPVLGVSIADVAPEDAEYYGLPSVSGVMVQTVDPEGASAAAGIQMEDIILAIDGVPAGYVGGLQAMVATRRPGDRVAVTIFRDGRERELTLRLGEADLANEPEVVATTQGDKVERLGIEVQEITEEIAAQARLDRPGGALITQTVPGGAAARRQLFRGFRILEINDVQINSVEDVSRVLNEVPGGAVVHFVVDAAGVPPRVYNIRMPG